MYMRHQLQLHESRTRGVTNGIVQGEAVDWEEGTEVVDL